MRHLLVALGVMALLPLAAIYNGWAFSTLWNWFVVPLGFPALGIAHGFGVGLVAASMSRHIPRKKDDRAEMFAHELCVPGTCVFIGWLVRFWM